MRSTTSDPETQPWRSLLGTQLRRGYESDNPLPAALFYLALLALAELVTVFVAPQLGVLLHLGGLFLLLLHSALVWERPLHRLLLSLAFVPLIRVVSMSLPLVGFPLVAWYGITSVPLFASAVVAMRLLGLGRRGLGLTARGWGWPLQLLVGLAGLGLGAVEYWILRPAPLVETFNWQAIWLPALVLLVSTGYLEELIFRGLMQQTAVEQLGRWRGVVYVALFFAVLHAGYLSLLDVLFVLAVGLFFGLVVQRTGSLLGVTLAHGLTNITLFLIMPFLAAGELQIPRLPLAQTGPPPATAVVETVAPSPTATASPLPAAAEEAVGKAAGPAAKPTRTRPPSASPTPAPLATPVLAPSATPARSATAPPGSPAAPSAGGVATPAMTATGTPAVTPANTLAATTFAQHTVQPGQTLAFLARYYQTSEAAIRAQNDLGEDASLEVGQQLWIPVPWDAPIVPTGRATIVQSGDTLSRIARAQETTVEELILLNWLPDPDRILPGQLLWLPAEPGNPSLPPEQ